MTGGSSDRICQGLTGDTYPMALPATVARAAGVVERDDGFWSIGIGDDAPGPFPTREMAEAVARRAS